MNRLLPREDDNPDNNSRSHKRIIKRLHRNLNQTNVDAIIEASNALDELELKANEFESEMKTLDTSLHPEAWQNNNLEGMVKVIATIQSSIKSCSIDDIGEILEYSQALRVNVEAIGLLELDLEQSTKFASYMFESQREVVDYVRGLLLNCSYDCPTTILHLSEALALNLDHLNMMRYLMFDRFYEDVEYPFENS